MALKGKIGCLILLCCGWACGAFASAQGAVVLQIGSPDGNYHELAIAGHHADYAKQFAQGVDFVAGQSQARRDWPYVLPGPADAWAGSKTHPFKIHFQLPEIGPGYYRLTIDFVSTHPSAPPLLVVEINGESVSRQLPRGSSDDALSNAQAGARSLFQQLIPPAWLRMGDNVITLTAARGSWALFDDVRLESGLPAPAETLRLSAEPLPFFKRTAKELERAIKVSIQDLQSGAASARLSWNSKNGADSRALQLRFGENAFMIMAPDADELAFTLRTAQRAVKTTVALPPAKKFRVFIVPTVHTDVGYTDFQERVKIRHANNGLRALALLGEYPFFKWYSETFWQLNALLELHPDKKEAVWAYLRRRRWGLSGDYANMLTGLCSSEALARLTLDSRNLANRAGFDLNSVILDDVPSAIGALPMVLANSGIKYFVEGANNDRAPYAGQTPNPFYWEGADGSRVLAEITTRPAYGGAGFLLPSVARAMEQLPPFLARFEGSDYPYDAVLINGAFSDNRPVQSWLPKVVQEWNAQWDYPKLTLAQPEEFFRYIEKNFSNNIPTLKTDFGGWWEDGAGSSSLETALSRRAEERAVTAEMLHSLAAILGDGRYPKTDFDKLWHDILLYNEHTWGAAGSISQPRSEQTIQQWNVKRSFADDADASSRRLLDSGMAKLAAMAPAADLVVFNSLAWPRDALVRAKAAMTAAQDVASKENLPCQPLPEGGVCFVAHDLPSVGYRCYRRADDDSAGVRNAAGISGAQMENEFYRVTLNPETGGIQSIYDKQLRRELVDAKSPYDLGELIYVTGGEGSSAVHSDLNHLPPPKFEYQAQTPRGFKSLNGPVFGELTSEAAAENFPKITMRVRLYRGLKQVDLIYELDKTETLRKEAVYLAFPFAFDARQGGLWLEYPEEITQPLKDQHASACRDWYSVQRWLAVSDHHDTVELCPLDAPLFTLGRMTASTWPRQLSLERGHVFAYLMNNYWHTNYKAEQGGHFVFRYSITSRAGAFSKQDAVRSGWNLFCPAVARSGQGAHRPVVASAAKSLVAIEPRGLPLTTIKQAEDMQSFIFRCCDYAGAGGTATLSLPAPARQVWACNLVETSARSLPQRGPRVAAPVQPFAPLTLKVRFAR